MAYFNFTINGNSYTNDPTSALPYGYKFTGYEYIPALGNLFTDLAATVAVVLGYKEAANNSKVAAGISETNAGNSATAALASAVAAASAAAGLQGTSTSAVTIGTGTKTFTTQAGKQFNNTYVLATDSGDVNSWVFGYCTYSGSTLSMSVAYSTDTSGSGSRSSWVLSVIGPRGLTGLTGSIGSLQTATDYAQDPGTSTGLLYGFKAGDFRADNVCTHHNAGQIALANNTTNYVYAVAAGPTSNTTGFPSGCFPMSTAVTSAGAISSVTDKRAFALSSPSLAGGGAVTSSGTSIVLTAASLRVQAIAMTTDNLTLQLPDATTLATGGQLHVTKNVGSFPFVVLDGAGNQKLFLMPGQEAVWWLAANADAAGTWAIGNANVDGSAFLPYINSGTVAYSSVALPASSYVRGCAMDATHLLLGYIDNSGSKLYCVVATITSNYTLSFGSPVSCGSTNVYAAGGFDMDGMGANKAIIIYANGVTGQVEATIVTVSGTVPAPNTAKTLYGSGANCCAVKAIGTGAAICAVCSSSNLHVSYLSAASTTITEPSTYSQAIGNTYSYPRLSIASATAGFLSYRDSASGYAMAAVVTISGATVASTTPAQMSAGSVSYVSSCVANAKKALVAFDGIVVVATISSGAAVAGSPVTIKSGSPTWTDIVWAGDKAVMTYTNASGYAEQSFLQFANQGQTKVRALGDTNEINSIASGQFGSGIINNNKLFTVFRNGSSTFANIFLEDIVS